MRWAENKKQILVLNSVPTRRRLENSKKNSKKIQKIKKTSFPRYFYPNRDEIGREREKTNFVLNFVPIRHGLENSQKNSKKFQKIKKSHFDIISIQTGLR